MSENLMMVAIALLAYLIGSISFAVVVSRLMGLPRPHSYGSGNPGATNVLRTGNKTAAILTLLGDALKGWLALALAKTFFADSLQADILLSLVALSVFIGHLYPVFHGFKGGKGVATAAGVLFGLNLILGFAALATWLAIAIFFRYSSLAALMTAIFAPLYCFFLFGTKTISLAVLLIGLLLVWRHRSNIQNLMAGKESRIGSKK